jgi:hypothetical protein
MQLHYSSTEYPQLSGAAESAVQILKRLRQVCSMDEQLFRATLYLQNTAKRNHTLSPAQVFLGRSTPTPLSHTVRQVTSPWKRHFLERVKDQRSSRSDAVSRTATREFLSGDAVLVHNVRGGSQQAIVVSKATEPRAYIVEFCSGARSVRNHIFLTRIPRSPQSNAGSPSLSTAPPEQPATPPPRLLGSPSPLDPKTCVQPVSMPSPAPSVLPPASSRRTEFRPKKSAAASRKHARTPQFLVTLAESGVVPAAASSGPLHHKDGPPDLAPAAATEPMTSEPPRRHPVHHRLGARIVNCPELAPRRRRKDYCRLCKIDHCEHCFYRPNESSDSDQ